MDNLSTILRGRRTWEKNPKFIFDKKMCRCKTKIDKAISLSTFLCLIFRNIFLPIILVNLYSESTRWEEKKEPRFTW